MTLIELMAKAIDQSDDAVGGERHMEYWHDLARAALSAIESAGYRIVPVEPTEEMETAGILAQDAAAGTNNIARAAFRSALRAAVAAAPKVTE